MLWPTELSESDHESLEAVARMAQVFDAEVFALHVIGDVAEEVYGEKTKEGKDREMLLGSVAYKIVRTAPCNVMVVK